VFSQRSEFERRRNRLQLAREAAARDGRVPLDLTESNPTAAQLPYPPELLAALDHPAVGRYRPEPLGLPSARGAISDWMAGQGCAVAAERIVVTASTSEAYAFLFKLLCDAGDEVLVPAPSYPLFAQLAQLEQTRIVHYPLRYDGHWHVALDTLLAGRTNRTRALVTVHPNNPTGSYLKRDELALLGSLGLPIISDEVFAPYPLEQDPTRASSALLCPETLVCTLHGLSKLAGLPQLKLAWICLGGPASLVDEARARLELIADAFL
jgi:alanine-synthesizing transaminase